MTQSSPKRMTASMFFASDNGSPADPEVRQAISFANAGCALPYGDDPLTAESVDRIRGLPEAPEAAVCFVTSGTVVHALAFAPLRPAWGGICCHGVSHADNDECGATEFSTTEADVDKFPEIAG